MRAQDFWPGITSVLFCKAGGDALFVIQEEGDACGHTCVFKARDPCRSGGWTLRFDKASRTVYNGSFSIL